MQNGSFDGISRRGLIRGAGALALGAALAQAGGGLVSRAEGGAKASYPWPYKKIDPARAADIAYENWYRNFCAYSTLSGIFVPLQESVGEPYTMLPLEAFVFGHGGTVGWGTLCGTLFGAGIATSFAAGKEGEKILNDVIAWYSESELPTFVPKNPKATFKNINRSDSPLCHVSVGRWMKKEGVGFNSPERRDRCARLSASVAAKTAELLNAWADGIYKPAHGSQVTAYQITAQSNCKDCHAGK